MRTLHYVKNEQAPDWLRCGWIVVRPNCEMHHDYYSCVMEWLCDCPMVRPGTKRSLNDTLRNWLVSRDHRVPHPQTESAEG